MKRKLNYKNIKYLGRYGRVELADKKIGICHELLIDKVLGLEECDLVFYGHTRSAVDRSYKQC